MRLIDPNKFPPGGWQFVNPETGWRVPEPRTYDLSWQVQEVINHRRANRKYGQPTEPAVVRQEIIEQTCQRIMRDLPANEWKRWISMTNEPEATNLKKNLPPPLPLLPVKPPVNPKGVLAGIVGRLASVPRGVATLAEWVGEGCPPVEQAQAENRGRICTSGAEGGKPCPHNVDSNFFDIFTGPIADAIKRISELKHHLNLNTSYDAQLGVCDICGCHLKTKVFVGIHTIRKFDARGWLRQPPPFCWMRTEP